MTEKSLVSRLSTHLNTDPRATPVKITLSALLVVRMIKVEMEVNVGVGDDDSEDVDK